MRTVLFEDDVRASTPPSNALATQSVPKSYSKPVTRYLVGRLGLDPSTLRVFPDRLGTSISVQICWPDEVQCPPTSSEVLSRLTSWLDSWLDAGSFHGQVTVQFREIDSEGFGLRFGGRHVVG